LEKGRERVTEAAEDVVGVDGLYAIKGKRAKTKNSHLSLGFHKAG